MINNKLLFSWATFLSIYTLFSLIYGGLYLGGVVQANSDGGLGSRTGIGVFIICFGALCGVMGAFTFWQERNW